MLRTRGLPECTGATHAYTVFCIQSTETVPAELHRLELAPDLVDQVYRALLDAISWVTNTRFPT